LNRDQRELQREDRQSHEAKRNREFNEERAARWPVLSDRQQERRQAEQKVEEHPDKATQGVPHCVIAPTTRSGPAPDLLALPRRSAHVRPTPLPALVTTIADSRTRSSHQREFYVSSSARCFRGDLVPFDRSNHPDTSPCECARG
jgi:hypothetical protein